MAKLRKSVLVLFTALVTAVTLFAPLGTQRATAAAVGEWVPFAYGQVSITSVTPIKAQYAVGDVVTVAFRMESNATAPKRDMVGTSNTLANATSCDWAAFPAGTAGKYNCAKTGTTAVTRTITAADAQAGVANFDLTWTHHTLDASNVRTGESITNTITGSLPVVPAATPTASPSPTQTADAPKLALEMTRTDVLGTPVREGQTLTFSITYTNLTGAALTAFPRSSNLSGVLSTGTPNCRYANLAAGASFTCTTATYTVTAADVAAGSFTPTASFDATSDREGTQVLQAGVVASLPAITTAAAPVGPREDGVYTTLAVAGDGGFACHRIPALTEAPNGWIVAQWDGRPNSCQDAPQPNSIVQRISKDGGQTFGPLVTVAAGSTTSPTFGWSDPSLVVDRETKRMFSFFLKSFDQGWGGSVAGTDPSARNVLHAAVMHSDDNGVTWTAPRVITADITPDAAWRSRFAASGEGIQLRYGAHAGRLIQQYTINNNGVVQAVSVFSDDHGATWQAGTPVGTAMDENKVVELSDGRVMLNSRTQDVSARKVTISSDGGQTYGPVRVDNTLIDPRNNASIIRAYPNAPEGSAQAKVLLFSNAASTAGRTNGTVRVSFDDGATWSGSKVFEPGSMSYSTLTPLSTRGKYGLLFEGTGSTIRFMTISMDWLGVLPVAVSGQPQTVHRGANSVAVQVSNVSGSAKSVTLTATAPNGWTVGAIAPVALAAGETKTVTLAVTAPGNSDPGAYPLNLSLTDGTLTSVGKASLNLELQPGETGSVEAATTLLNSPPQQPAEPISLAFDGDPNTMYHSPWTSAVTMPVDIDMSLGDQAQQLVSLTVLPRQSGGNNGRINGYEVWTGDDVTSLTLAASGNMANTTELQVVPLTGTAKVVRLRVTSSYGDIANRYVSAAEIDVRVLQTVPSATPTATPTVTPTTTPTGTASPVPTVTVTAPTVTATAPVVTVTSSATATATAPPVTVTSSATVTATSTATVTAPVVTATAAPTVTATATVTAPPVTLTAPPVTSTPSTTAPPTTSGTPSASSTATASPAINHYVTPGFHSVGGRQWYTRCEPYSTGFRCFTDIYASQIKLVDGKLQWVQGWVFNTLTYTPRPKAEWGTSHLANAGEYTIGGRRWWTECGTATTGPNGCRSYLWTTYYVEDPAGSRNFKQVNGWVLNNLVSFT